MQRAALSVILGGMAGIAAGQGLFLQSVCAANQRSSLIEDDGYVAYLFLTAPGTQVPEREVVVYSRSPPVSKNDWWALSKTGDKPLLSQDLASADAVLAHPADREFSFRWSSGCDAVAVLHKGVPRAFVYSAEATGHSKAVGKPSAMGQPWNQQKYEAIFGR